MSEAVSKIPRILARWTHILATLDDKLLSVNMCFVVWVRFAAAIFVLREWGLVVLGVDLGLRPCQTRGYAHKHFGFLETMALSI